MDSTASVPQTVDQYLTSFPPEIREKLEILRQLIKEEAPEVVETIKYRMPTFVLKGKNFVHFAAFKNHIGFYPTPSGIDTFQKELAGFKTSKGAIQFPLSKPLPLALIRQIVRFRLKEISF